ncbi:FAD-dependent oxidoreductase [Actinomyces viscosus]|uniref:Anthranilate 1,2-dioxygenase electron transfer component n=1 Tax=Actinomyces viscosus TaxID=1656 RepID=A0A448PIK1_ACTVI|nr:FAD-dependent oxidoreductase [Actinomyces viscosus]TFH51875.1 FAD-dependent oxidoreductase [Actinomyces viscosus]VEI14767.1 Anthranilate 1,2-dioxygenase electron transfer component [Actinomyces viscosus]
MSYDVIVIGSGIGGLTSAGLLARAAGKRVLVLERRTEPGGLTHTFRRDGASWDVGVHYVGQVGPDSRGRAYFDYLSGGELEWNRMPDAYDRFVYPGIDLSVSSDPDRYERDLIAAFPQEAKAIRRYFQDVRRTMTWTAMGFIRGMVPRLMAPLLGLAQRLTGRSATATTKAYLDAHFRSPELKVVLASQWGDYGLPPSRSAFAVHAMIVSHYLDGGWFPRGGSARIARTFEKGIEQAGGAVRVAQEVTEILLDDDGAAAGVRVMDRRGPVARERIYRAPVIVSAVGASNTFNRLLPTSGEVGRLTGPARRTLENLGTGTSAITVFLRLRDDPRSIGLDGGNIWVNRDLDHERAQERSASLLEGRPHDVFVSFPSLKSGESPHTAELISFCDAKVFRPWADHPRGDRGSDYSALKECIGSGMLDLAESAAPGLTEIVDYMEVATPLTYEHYTTHPAGAFYGPPATPLRYRSAPLGPRTAIPGLFLSGQDAGSAGIMGALMGGVAAACQVLGPRGYATITSALNEPHCAPDPRQAHSLPEGKHHAALVSKRRLTPSVWEVVLRVEGQVDHWAPGQFARLCVGDNTWRDYSIAGLEDHHLRLLVSTRTGGRGSRFIEEADTGTTTVVELPLGGFRLVDSGSHRLFITTGTGIAPMLAMFAQAPGVEHDTLLFGCRHDDEDLTTMIDSPMPGRVVRCLSRQKAPGTFHGRVTDALTELVGDPRLDPHSTDVYLCGSAAMVSDTHRFLEHAGYESIYTEPY